MPYCSSIRAITLFLTLPLSALAGTSVQRAPATPDALPRAYRDLHPDSEIRLKFANHRNLHTELNPIFTDDWQLPSFELKKASESTGMVRTFIGKAIALGKTDLCHLARLTAYWAGEDSCTTHHMSSTGVHLHVGHCAVDPNIIPYGSVVQIPGVGIFLAVDTGSAVVSRTAARTAGHTTAEKGALVIDLFFETEKEGEEFAANGPTFATINWWTPNSTGHKAQMARSFFADEDWDKIYSKL
jgi:3D (Asp-Asp-Asp) domain-containing protein